MRTITIALCATLLFLSLAPQVGASADFTVAYDVRYSVEADGITKVTQRIALTNQTNRFFAREYRLSLRTRAIRDIRASDGGGPMPVSMQETDDGVEIYVTFNEKIVGTGKVLNFVLTYELSEAARKNGKIWEVVIPGIEQSEEITSYDVSLSVPSSFGEPSFLSPQPTERLTSGGRHVFRFNQESIIRSGVTAIFGTEQWYQFTLLYHLANPNLVAVQSEIALPPDTAYQDVTLLQMSPRPLDVRVDEDGNYLAKYELSRGQKMEIKATGIIEVHKRPSAAPAPLADDLRKRYLEPDRYWESTNPLIVEKAKELKTPRAIYQFVTDYLHYSQQRLNENSLERLGAVAALSRPSDAVCMEYTDLFIALARAAGIPAREVNGYAYTYDTKFRPLSLKNNADILHSWPEYFDDELGWVAVDPTWGSTTGGVNYFDQLDFNHVTFAIHGISSTQPYPAGAYKYESNQGPDVSVQFAQESIERSSTIELSLAVRSTVVSGIETPGKVIIRNTGNSATTAGSLSLSAGKLTFLTPQYINVGTVPAFANKEIEFAVQAEGWLRRDQDELVARLGAQEVRQSVQVAPLPLFQVAPWIGGVLLGAGVVFVGFVGISYYRRRRLRMVPAPSPHESISTNNPQTGEGTVQKIS